MSATEETVGTKGSRLGAAVNRVVPRPVVYKRRQRESWLVGIALAAIVPMFVHGFYGMDVANKAMIFIVLATGFYIQFALSGQFSLATSAFYATGAFTSAWAGEKVGGFLVGLVVGAIVAGLLGAVLKALLQRSPLLQFAIATLSFAALVQIIFREWESFTGGGAGKVGIPSPSILGKTFTTPTEVFYVSAAVALVGVGLLILLERSATQRDWTFVRDMSTVARVSGLPTTWIQITAFGVGASFMGAAGALTAYSRHFVDLSQFSAVISLDVLIMVLLGGSRSLWGPAVGAIVLTLLPEWLRDLKDYKDLVYAGLILVVILLIPEGLTSVPRRIFMAATKGRRKGATVASTTVLPGEAQP